MEGTVVTLSLLHAVLELQQDGGPSLPTSFVGPLNADKNQGPGGPSFCPLSSIGSVLVTLDKITYDTKIKITSFTTEMKLTMPSHISQYVLLPCNTMLAQYMQWLCVCPSVHHI